MATINGITIKNVKSFSGIEYPVCHECTVYNGTKRIGSYCEDQWGGSGHFSPSSLYNELKPFAEKYKSGCKESKYYDLQGDPEIFISRLLMLYDYQKVYRQNVKKGYTTTLYVCNSFKWISYGFRSPVDIAKLPSDVIKYIKKEFPKNDYCIWQANSEDAFNILIDSEHLLPSYLY